MRCPPFAGRTTSDFSRPADPRGHIAPTPVTANLVDIFLCSSTVSQDTTRVITRSLCQRNFKASSTSSSAGSWQRRGSGQRRRTRSPQRLDHRLGRRPLLSRKRPTTSNCSRVRTQRAFGDPFSYRLSDLGDIPSPICHVQARSTSLSSEGLTGPIPQVGKSLATFLICKCTDFVYVDHPLALRRPRHRTNSSAPPLYGARTKGSNRNLITRVSHDHYRRHVYGRSPTHQWFSQGGVVRRSYMTGARVRRTINLRMLNV